LSVAYERKGRLRETNSERFRTRKKVAATPFDYDTKVMCEDEKVPFPGIRQVGNIS